VNSDKPSWLLRWCFALLGLVIVGQVAVTLIGAGFCFYFFTIGTLPVGGCSGFVSQAREIWAESLAVVLALLMAGRNEPRDPPPPDQPT
jgi:hypothetical protein